MKDPIVGMYLAQVRGSVDRLSGWAPKELGDPEKAVVLGTLDKLERRIATLEGDREHWERSARSAGACRGNGWT